MAVHDLPLFCASTVPSRRKLLATVGAVAVLDSLGASRTRAQSREPLKIGVLSDLTGMVADLSGMGTVTSITMAVEDFGGTVNGRPIEILRGDHKNKADTGAAIARSWYDDGVTAIFDIGITSVALAVQTLTREKKRVAVYLSSASADLTGVACSPNGIHWASNNYAQALGAVRYCTQRGAKTWYFLTVDFTYGYNSQRDATALIEASGGRVLGATLHPFETTEFSSSLLAARASKADVVALATTSAHAINVVKQAEEFGLRQSGQVVVPLALTLPDVKAIGLEAGQGLIETAPYYWDRDDASRAFAQRYMRRFGKMPNGIQASAWGAVTHYLTAMLAVGNDNASEVLAQMRATPINDFMTKDGFIRADGRVIRDMYLLEVKKPAESTSVWDLERVVGSIPGTEAFRPADPAI